MFENSASGKHSKGKKQRGAALIFALLVAILLGVFAAFFTFKAQRNIKLAEIVSDQIEARLIADSQMNKAIYAISSLDFTEWQWPDSQIKFQVQLWGEAIEAVPGIQVSFQDLSGKLSVIPFRRQEWEKVLQFYGVDEVKASGIVDRIEDWMDSDSFKRVQGLEKRGYQYNNSRVYPRDAMMQTIDELAFIPGLDESLLNKIKDEVSYWGSSERSPLAGSRAMILAYGTEETYQQVLMQRKANSNVRLVYNKLQGVNPSLVNDVPSGLFRIKVEIDKGNFRFTREADVNMRGTDVMPFYVIGWQ